MLDSFGRDVAPFSVVASAFRTTLARDLGQPVDIYEESLDMARFADPGLEKPFVDFLEQRSASTPVDLVVPIGGPAVQFVAQYRERLFKETPVLFTAADPRLVPAGALRTNATLITHKIELPSLVESVLRLQPDTTNIVVVFGAAPLEKFWAGECRREWQVFTNRVSFSWLDSLSLPQIQERVHRLPPHSFIMFFMLLVDADGVPYDESDVLTTLHATANAPIFSYFRSQFGLGPIGGRLYQENLVGERAAQVAIRILRGEKPADIPPEALGVGPPVYDWRELTRWDIRPDRLPAGSTIEFREPPLWAQYRWHIVGVVAFCGVQTALILALVVNRSKRRQEEAVSALIADLSAKFVNIPPGQVDREIEDGQRRVCECLGLDLSSLWQWTNDTPPRFRMTHLYRPLGGPPTPERFDAEEYFPWALVQLKAGKVVAWSVNSDLPAEAARDLETWRAFGLKTVLNLPLIVGGGPPFGLIAFNDTQKDREWTVPLVRRLQLVAQVFANALARKQADQALRESEERLNLATESAGAGLWSVHIDTGRIWVTPRMRELLQFQPDEELTFDKFVQAVHPDDRDLIVRASQQAFETGAEMRVEHRVLLPDGSVRWINGRGRPHADSTGKWTRLTGTSIDITERKRSEEALQRSEQKYRRLHESMLDAFARVDMEGRIVECNAAYEDMVGYSQEELRQLTYRDLTPARWHDMEARIVAEQVLPAGTSRVYEKEYRHKAGAVFPVELRTFLIRDDAGQPTGMWGIVRDITERKRAEDALRETQTTLHAIIDSTNDFVWSVDPRSFGLMTFNRGLRDYFLRGRGIHLEPGMRPEDLFPPGEYVQRWRDLYRRALNEGPFTVEYSTYSQNIVLQLSLNVLKRDGKVFGVSAFGKDITELKRAEMALKESLERFRQVVEFAGEFIWEVDADGLYTYASPSLTRILEYAPEELVGKKHFYDLFEPSVREQLRAAALRAFAAHQSFRNFPNANLSKSGRLVRLETSGIPMVNASGDLIGYRGADTDVTGRMREQEILLQSEERLRLVLEANSEGVWDWHIPSGTVFFSRQYAAMLGYEPAEFPRDYETWKTLVHPDDLPRLAAEQAEHIQHGKPYLVEIRMQKKSGEWCWVQGRGTVVERDASGQAIRMVGTHRDITEQRRSEMEARELRSNLAHSGRVTLLGQLASALAHELNQPLGAILRNAEAAELILRERRPDLEELRAIVTDILKDDQRAGKVIDRLRSLLKRRSLDMQPVDLNGVISEVLSLVHADAATRRVKLTHSLAQKLPQVRGDRIHLQQVLLNLLINAIDALTEVAPNTRRIHVSARQADADMAEVRVSDSGPGIPDGAAERLFEPFFTTKTNGMGMGLAVSRTIIEAHHGKIWGENRPGGGACFCFTLPLTGSQE